MPIIFSRFRKIAAYMLVFFPEPHSPMAAHESQ